MANTMKKIAFRIQHIPSGFTKEQLTEAIRQACDEEERAELELVGGIAPPCYASDSDKTAVVYFLPKPPKILRSILDDKTGMTERQIKINSSIINIDKNFFGLTQLFKPADETEVSMDVVAITGLDGNAFGSWKSRSMDVMWLRDFLMEDLPNCRVMTYGYNTKLSSNMSYRFEDFCTQFLEPIRLARASQKAMRRPLVLIGHSYGSRIITKSIVRCKIFDSDPQFSTLLAAVKAVVFFGAPHRGMETEDVERYLSEEYPDSDSRKKIVAELRRDDDGIKRELKDFIDLVGSFFVIPIYERKPSRKLLREEAGSHSELYLPTISKSYSWNRTGQEYISVDEDSALLNLPFRLEVPIPSESDHSNMVKFDHKDPTYQVLLGYLRDMACTNVSATLENLLYSRTPRLASLQEPQPEQDISRRETHSQGRECRSQEDERSEKMATLKRMSVARNQTRNSLAEADLTWVPFKDFYFPLETSSEDHREGEGWLQKIVNAFTWSDAQNLKIQPRRFGVLSQENRLEKVMVEFRPYPQELKQLNPQEYDRCRWQVVQLANMLLSATSCDSPSPFPGVPLRCLSESSNSSTPCFLLAYTADGLYGLDEALNGHGMPSIEDRLGLTLHFARSLASLHLAGLVHGSINTDNLYLYFDTDMPSGQPDWSSRNISHATPMLAGFEIARDFVGQSYKLDIEDPDLRVYLHPDRLDWGDEKAYQHPVHDVFGLGMTMIEIGLWRRFKMLRKYQEAQTDDDRRGFAIRLKGYFTDGHSDGRMGAKYGAIIAYCLGLSPDPFLGKTDLEQGGLSSSLFGSPNAALVVEALTQIRDLG